MEVIILADAAAVGRTAALKIASVFRAKPDGVLGLATGSSPLGTYAALRDLVEAGTLDLGSVRGFALDEYVGIPPDHPESYLSVIRRTVVEPLRMNPALVRVPDGRADDILAACADYERAIVDAGGIDVQILGIGANGHIGFNEPTSSFASRTRIKTLAPKTIADNARFFASADEVPKHCLTQGLGTILDARELVLVATGEAKVAAIAATVEGPLTSMCPGSALQLHQHATVIVDEAAAAGLTLSEYYRHTYANKPGWQQFDV
jgi:glucosamine-6-phosphate deaminase